MNKLYIKGYRISRENMKFLPSIPAKFTQINRYFSVKMNKTAVICSQNCKKLFFRKLLKFVCISSFFVVK